MRMVLYFLLFIFVLLPSSSALAEEQLAQVPDTSIQERLEPLLAYDFTYDVGFLWLDQVAVATFKFQESLQPDLYIASLSAKTVGIAATLTRNRQQQYVSMMRLMPDGSFRSVRHTSQRESGGVIRTKVYLYDYDKQAIVTQYSKNNKLVYERERSIKGEVFPSDMLTAYFNLVSGAYGPMQLGQHYEIASLGKEGVGYIYIDFLSPEDLIKVRAFFADDLLICQVKIDPDVFDSKNGVLYLGYDKNMHLQRGIVIDVIGMGDVRGVLREE